jgi:hypothetical protein
MNAYIGIFEDAWAIAFGDSVIEATIDITNRITIEIALVFPLNFVFS